MKNKNTPPNTVFEKLIHPLSGLIQQCSHKRECKTLSDQQWIKLGLTRTPSQEPSGRAFIQMVLGIVNRLSDYKWSSYHYYAYRKAAPGWLKMSLILGQVSGKDKKQSYRRKVQQYADEKGSIWEDVRYGLVYGTEAFLNDFKKRYPSSRKDLELPQHNRMYRDVDPEKIIAIAFKEMQIDLELIQKSKRIPKNLTDQRSLLIYLLWESGRFGNQKIGSLLSTSYSNVSRLIFEIRKKLEQDEGLRGKYKALSALIKV